ncbi:sigma-54-dependent transcriptional regulator [Mucilaginibacter rubeus]|uniref:Sigma-54-dependent Fis family transcriptional regulator n=1 Tax=Mucilaginibacter rubeus TaxID=2027860 RepID=A0A5C1I978_9SPHI|nr:sigma-54 dependent transcriptional regulator [Mucilaginibacter rubeus]QEM14246.1 sigma-54-dependent Fis family transcriptional regulator [Mucilaginibacter rubeus]
MKYKAKILIVEDQYIEANNLEVMLRRADYRVCTIARSVSAAVKVIEQESPDMVLLDIQLKGKLSGIDLAKLLSRKNIAFIFLSGNSKQEFLDAAKTTRPFGFLTKPFREKDILSMLEIALYAHRENLALTTQRLNSASGQAANSSLFPGMIGGSPQMQKLQQQMARIASSDISVLIVGESGTGKELIARNIHLLSAKARQSLISVNCAALPPTLIESELFGHEKGAFTGALDKRIGRFEQADGGTIFLDEIGELPIEVQAKFLRVLQEKEVEVIGGKTKKVNVRVIAATNRNLQEDIVSGKFRADLYYRLNVFPLVSPPLRERKEDLPLLVDHFIERLSKLEGSAVTGMSEQAMQELLNYDWPGNVRELENIVHRSILLATGPVINSIGDLRSYLPKAVGANNFMRTIEEVEREHIVAVLERCNWKVYGPGGAAEVLGIKVPTLNSRLKKLNIEKVRPNRSDKLPKV